MKNLIVIYPAMPCLYNGLLVRAINLDRMGVLLRIVNVAGGVFHVGIGDLSPIQKISDFNILKNSEKKFLEGGKTIYDKNFSKKAIDEADATYNELSCMLKGHKIKCLKKTRKHEIVHEHVD